MKKIIILMASLLLVAGFIGYSAYNVDTEGDAQTAASEDTVMAEEGEMPARGGGTMDGEEGVPPEDGEERPMPEDLEEGEMPERGGGAAGGKEMLDTASAAEELGVTEEEFLDALGDSTQGPPDFAEVAETLGVTEDELLDAME